jgi:hypothetical protein
MNNVVPFPGEGKNGAGSDGGGPEDPMLEQRVGRLEEKVDRIEGILVRLEPKILEVLQTVTNHSAQLSRLETTIATKDELHKVQVDTIEIKSGQLAAEEQLNGKIGEMDGRLSGKIGEMDGRLSGKLGAIDGRLSGIEGRIGSVEGRFNQVPTIWGMLGIVATLLIGMAGLIFTAGKFFHP